MISNDFKSPYWLFPTFLTISKNGMWNSFLLFYFNHFSKNVFVHNLFLNSQECWKKVNIHFFENIVTEEKCLYHNVSIQSYFFSQTVTCLTLFDHVLNVLWYCRLSFERCPDQGNGRLCVRILHKSWRRRWNSIHSRYFILFLWQSYQVRLLYNRLAQITSFTWH